MKMHVLYRMAEMSVVSLFYLMIKVTILSWDFFLFHIIRSTCLFNFKTGLRCQ